MTRDYKAAVKNPSMEKLVQTFALFEAAEIRERTIERNYQSALNQSPNLKQDVILVDKIKDKVADIYKSKEVREARDSYFNARKNRARAKNDESLKKKLGDKEYKTLLEGLEKKFVEHGFAAEGVIRNAAEKAKITDEKMVDALLADFFIRQNFRVDWELLEEKEKAPDPDKGSSLTPPKTPAVVLPPRTAGMASLVKAK